ncbi:MAG: hypothetical protein ACYC5O_21585 [Anaerolineae bacterium]
MEGHRTRAFVGGMLVLLGILFLLDSLGLFALGAAVIGVLFAAGGLAFLYVFFARRDQWWAVIPGFALLGIGILIVVSELAPGLEAWGGAIFLGMLSLAFWVIYLTQREYWWAVIPGGTLTTLAVVTIVGSSGDGELSGAVFFLGLGLTFALLSLLPTPEGRLRWALIPAGVMLLMGLFIAASAVEATAYVWPIALIVGGLALLWRALRSGRDRKGDVA